PRSRSGRNRCRSVQGWVTSRNSRVLLPTFRSGESCSGPKGRSSLSSHWASAWNIQKASNSARRHWGKGWVLARKPALCYCPRPPLTMGTSGEGRPATRKGQARTTLGSHHSMQQVTGTLDDLRGEIDKIDDALQDLLARRVSLSRAIAKAKLPGAS